jgi:hypothetical protein
MVCSAAGLRRATKATSKIGGKSEDLRHARQHQATHQQQDVFQQQRHSHSGR